MGTGPCHLQQWDERGLHQPIPKNPNKAPPSTRPRLDLRWRRQELLYPIPWEQLWISGICTEQSRNLDQQL